MKIVIQCASGKESNAGIFKEGGKDILFVAKPSLAPDNNEYIFRSPNDITRNGTTYTEQLSQYNRQSKNPLNLLPAYKLYNNDVYRALVNKYGLENIFILSAGWGLISADFLTPSYNITFSTAKNVNPEFRRKKSDVYHDLCHLPLDCADDLVFIGGQGYQSLFDRLTHNYFGNRIVFFNSANIPQLKNCKLIKFVTTQRTNWHYTCAKQLIDGVITI